MPNNGRITLCPFYRDEKNNPQPATNFKNGTYSITNAYEFFFVLNGGRVTSLEQTLKSEMSSTQI